MDRGKREQEFYRGRLILPQGVASDGRVAVRGVGAVLFAGSHGETLAWAGNKPAGLELAGPGGERLSLGVYLNGYAGEWLDLSIRDGVDAAAARALGMFIAGEPWTPESAGALYRDQVELGLAEIDEALRGFVNSLADFLFDLATSTRQNTQARQSYYDALNHLKRNNDRFRELFTASLRAQLKDPEKERETRFASLEDADASHLDLVNFSEMEERLEVERIINDALQRFRIDLESLTLRVSDLFGLGAAQAKALFHPAYQCRALEEAVHALGFSPEALRQSLRFFHREWVRKLTAFYARINGNLAEAGLRPGLEDELYRGGSIIEFQRDAARRSPRGERERDSGETGRDDAVTAQRSAAPADTAPAPAEAAEPAPEPPRAPRQKHEAIYDAVVNALKTRQAAEQEDAPPADEAEPAAPAASAETVAAALLALQNATQAGDGGVGPLRNLLAGESVDPSVRTALGGEAGNRLEFVDDVFSTMRGNLDISDGVKPLLERLRIPLARLSLLEPRFFADPGHPAHKFLDKLSRLATTENFPNRVLERKLEEIVTLVASGYADDSAVFDDALGRLGSLVQQHERTLNKNIDRVISGMEGREQLRRAWRTVDRLLAAYIKPPAAPRVLLELLDAGWRDLLRQTVVREGEGSAPWREQVATLEAVCAALEAVEAGNAPSRLPQALRRQLDQLREEIRQAQPDNVTHGKALRDLKAVLSGEEPLETLPVEAPLDADGEPEDERLEQLPRLHRWLKRVDQLRIGTVMSYRDRKGHRKRMRLVWISDDRERFAFVNDLGQKVGELTRLQLARKLSHGLAPPDPLDRMSVLDQGIYGTLARAQERLTFRRTHDPQTRLLNAETLRQRLQRTVEHAQRNDVQHAFLLLDIDRFHLVNELYGEEQGDEVIHAFAQMLAQLNERRSITARLADDRFGIVLAYRDRDEALAFAERMREDIAGSSLPLAGEAVSFTVSIGVAPIATETPEVDTVLAQAEGALALAKEQGRNCCVAYDRDEEQIAAARRERERSRVMLDEAIATDSLVLRAQPIVQSALDGSQPPTHHYEVLLSIRQEDGSLLSPTEFIASAERFGFINGVDRWVVRRVCEWISSLMDRQKVVPQLSINLSGSSLTDDRFMDYVLEQISEFGVGTSKLCFEITETGAIENLNKAADFIRTLRNIGCTFSLDDFGTGMASHQYLRELPVDNVKIDGMFIRDMASNPNDYAMVRSINDLAHFLGQKTIAESVESVELIEPLHEIGVDYLQGWGVGMPRPLEEVTLELSPLAT